MKYLVLVLCLLLTGSLSADIANSTRRSGGSAGFYKPPVTNVTIHNAPTKNNVLFDVATCDDWAVLYIKNFMLWLSLKQQISKKNSDVILKSSEAKNHMIELSRNIHDTYRKLCKPVN